MLFNFKHSSTGDRFPSFSKIRPVFPPLAVFADKEVGEGRRHVSLGLSVSPQREAMLNQGLNSGS